jgi:hypothetical protein
VEFLRNLKLTCQDLDAQWAARSKTRSAETKAVQEAISIITADDNMDLLRNSVSLFQLESSVEEGTEMQVRRNKVISSLRKAAQEPFFATEDLLNAWHGRSGPILSSHGTPRQQLSTLAITASLDSFTKIKKAMDQMTADLKDPEEEQSSEVKFKAHCNKEFDATDKEEFRKNEEKKDLENLIDKLTKLMAKLTKEIGDATNQVGETEVAIKKSKPGSRKRECRISDHSRRSACHTGHTHKGARQVAGVLQEVGSFAADGSAGATCQVQQLFEECRSFACHHHD